MIKAQYSAAEAQVKIKENMTGISEEMNDLGMVLKQGRRKDRKYEGQGISIR